MFQDIMQHKFHPTFIIPRLSPETKNTADRPSRQKKTWSYCSVFSINISPKTTIPTSSDPKFNPFFLLPAHPIRHGFSSVGTLTSFTTLTHPLLTRIDEMSRSIPPRDFWTSCFNTVGVWDVIRTAWKDVVLQKPRAAFARLFTKRV